MAKTLLKIGGVAGAGSLVVQDNAGNCELLVDGTKVLDAQGSAIVSITDNSGGTGSDTIAAIGATYDQAEVRNAVASLSDKLEEVLAALRAHGLIAS